ncbi:unnamed protein product [Rangifer tarandus platyrhynchus]|uniref:Uncharacterized protein n=1 Tax=Rangifer tarandus platyrhynchus TaxID=3082113 RepID=A0ABN8ZJ28_RANTA|nr:unnamed protein product [Rangifer tarandus platyrhynchus]
MPPSLGSQPQSRQLLQKGTVSPNGRAEHGAAARSLPSWRAERPPGAQVSVPARRVQGGHRSAAGRGWGGEPSAPRRDGLSRLPGLGHLPRTGAGVPKPSVGESPGDRLSERRARRCSRSVAAGPVDPSVRLAPGSLLALHFFFFLSVQFGGVFYLET